MKAALYIVSVHPFSGRTAICLGLGRRMQADGFHVGYFKPMGTLTRQVSSGKYCDEDAVFARQVLNLSEPPEVLAPVCVTPGLLEQQLAGQGPDLTTHIVEAYNVVRQDKDVLVIEGGASLREGYAINLATPKVARMLGAPVMAVIRFDGEVRLLDDAIATRARLGDQLIGVVINLVPQDKLTFVRDVVVPALEKQHISVYGVLPQEKPLLATSVGEIVDAAGGRFLTHAEKRDELVENLTVGAMSASEARARLDQIHSKAVITGGDRTDIIEAALETGAKLIILTGNLAPAADVLKHADQLGVPVVSVAYDTLITVERIERFFGRGRLAQRAKLARLVAIMSQGFDFQRLYQLLGLG